MAVLRMVLAIALATLCARSAYALDYEKKLRHDATCVVEAFSSGGDVYLKCKDVKGVLKTSVDMPGVAASFLPGMTPEKYMRMAKKAERAKIVWGILDFSFSTQLYVLITFNDDKTLIQDAVAYVQPRFDERIGRKDKMEL